MRVAGACNICQVRDFIYMRVLGNVHVVHIVTRKSESCHAHCMSRAWAAQIWEIMSTLEIPEESGSASSRPLPLCRTWHDFPWLCADCRTWISQPCREAWHGDVCCSRPGAGNCVELHQVWEPVFLCLDITGLRSEDVRLILAYLPPGGYKHAITQLHSKAFYTTHGARKRGGVWNSITRMLWCIGFWSILEQNKHYFTATLSF